MNEIKFERDKLIEGSIERGYTDAAWIDTDADGNVRVGTYPGREYPYDLLYGGNPHTLTLYDTDHDGRQIAWVRDNWAWLEDHYFRGIFLWTDIYESYQKPSECADGVHRYILRDPAAVKEFVAECRDHGLQVGCYLRSPSLRVRKDGVIFWGDQDLATTLYETLLLMWWHGFTMIYGDSFDCGSLPETLWFLDRLRFYIDHVAKSCGFERGILSGHGSFSHWDGLCQGMADIPVRQRLDYLLTGESLKTPPINGDDPTWHRFHNDNGRGSALWDVKWREKGTSAAWPASVMTRAEIMRTVAEQSGCARCKLSTRKEWEAEYFSIYAQKRQEYQKKQSAVSLTPKAES